MPPWAHHYFCFRSQTTVPSGEDRLQHPEKQVQCRHGDKCKIHTDPQEPLTQRTHSVVSAHTLSWGALTPCLDPQIQAPSWQRLLLQKPGAMATNPGYPSAHCR